MRIYILVGPETERPMRESRVKSSLEELKKDPRGHYSLSLEPIPIITSDLDKGKGRVFDYGSQETSSRVGLGLRKDMTLRMGSNDKTSPEEKMNNEERTVVLREEERKKETQGLVTPSPGCSTVYRTGYSISSSFGIDRKKRKVRKRPSKSKGKLKSSEVSNMALIDVKKKGKMVGNNEKRKAEGEIGEHTHKIGKSQSGSRFSNDMEQAAESSNHEIVPNERLSTI